MQANCFHMKPHLIIIIALSGRCYYYFQFRGGKHALVSFIDLSKVTKLGSFRVDTRSSWSFPALHLGFSQDTWCPEKLAMMTVLNCPITTGCVWHLKISYCLFFSVLGTGTVICVAQSLLLCSLTYSLCPGQAWTITGYIYETSSLEAWAPDYHYNCSIIFL